MRKVFLSWIWALVAFAGYAQNYMVVDSEKIFKSQADYTEALTTLDELAKAEQKRVDEKFAEVESLYNRYMRDSSARAAGDSIPGVDLRKRGVAHAAPRGVDSAHSEASLLGH